MISLRGIVRNLRKKRFSYEPLIEVRIYKEAILHNLYVFRADTDVAPVLKSNAYGHGLVPVAKILDRQNTPFFCVDSFFEALILRNESVRTPLLIIGYTPLQNILHGSFKAVSFSILSLDELEIISKKLTVPRNFHLKIDTGMHRQGVPYTQIGKAIELIKQNSHIHIEGAYTHLADADTPNSLHTKEQIERWNQCAALMRETFSHIRYLHCAATSGSFYSASIDANVMRLGIGLYGIEVGPEKHNLKPTLSVHTRIASVRNIQPGESVGYNAIFTATMPMRVAAVPAGYAEGIDRRLSNKGMFMLHNTPCPIVGRVSMNITSIDVTNVPNVKLDDEVVVISNEPGTPTSIENIAKICSTIPYEILVHIPAHLRRVVY